MNERQQLDAFRTEEQLRVLRARAGYQDLSPITKEIANYKINLLHSLTYNETKVFHFLLRKIGNLRVPKYIPLQYIATSTKLTYEQSKYAIKKLTNKGYLEKYTSHKDPKGNKQIQKYTYYRLKQSE